MEGFGRDVEPILFLLCEDYKTHFSDMARLFHILYKLKRYSMLFKSILKGVGAIVLVIINNNAMTAKVDQIIMICLVHTFFWQPLTLLKKDNFPVDL